MSVERTEAYRRWNAALTAEYFGENEAARPVYLAVDDDELIEIEVKAGEEHSMEPDAFIRAVRVEARRGGDLFRSFLRESLSWREQDLSEPPYIGLLGLCVLAASRMARDPESGVWGNDYYSQLNPLLGRPRYDGRPPNFDELWRLWEDLTKWLDDDLGGARGRSTVRTHPFFVHIGYPISQCVLRAADRRKLPDFFHTMGLEPGAEISGERLLTLFRAWARPGCPLTAQGQRVVASATSGIEEALTQLLVRELEHWDGELRDERGRRRGEIVLFAESLAGGRRVELRFYARRPQGFPDTGWVSPDGKPIELRAAGDGWYGRLPFRVSSDYLREGLSLTSDGFALALDPGLAVPLRATFLPEAGWMSVRQASALEEHIVFVHSSVEDEFRAFLGRHAESGWRLSKPTGDLPPGWLVADRVRIASIPDAVPDALRRLVPRLNTAMRFDGGLPLSRQLYLEGGEPDVWVTIDEKMGAAVSVDDAVEQLTSGIVKLKLSDAGLPSGLHTVSVPGETRRFTSVWTYGRVTSDGAGALGHVLQKNGCYRPQALEAVKVDAQVHTGQVVICGAHIRASASDLPGDPFAPVVLRSGFERYTLLGATPGEIAKLEAPPKPDWLFHLKPVPTYQYFEHDTPFRAQLVIYEGRPYEGQSAWRLRAAHGAVLPPLVGAADAGPLAVQDWADAVLSVARADVEVPSELANVWAEYLQRADAITEGRYAA